jgi:hypothetical protein
MVEKSDGNKMKVAVIGFARSRSSILLEAINLFYKIPILQENLAPNQTLESFLLNIYKQTKGVIRFHPDNAILYKKNSYSYLESFNFKQYDKIFFTTRESAVDYICSYSLALELNKWTYKSLKDFDSNIPIINFSMDNELHVKSIRRYVYSQLVVDKIKKHFIKQGITSVSIEYNDIPSFIKNNYPGVKISHLETHYEYKNIFSNYSDIENYYLNMRSELVRRYDAVKTI